MAFQDLPPEWDTMPLTDSRIAADVVDLCLKIADRIANSVLFILCDEQGRALQPLVIDGMDWTADETERSQLFRLFGLADIPSVVMAVSAEKPIDSQVADAWHQTARAELERYDVTLIGFYSADTAQVWEPFADAA